MDIYEVRLVVINGVDCSCASAKILGNRVLALWRTDSLARGTKYIAFLDNKFHYFERIGKILGQTTQPYL